MRFLIPLLLLFSVSAEAQTAGGNSTSDIDCYTVSPTLQTGGAYTADTVLGGELSLEDPSNTPNKTKSGFIKQLYVVDQDDEKQDLYFYFFCAEPTGTYTDNVALDITDADALNLCCEGGVAAADYKTINDNATAMVTLDCLYKVSDGFDLKLVAKTDGTTPQFTSATDLQFKVCLIQSDGS